MEVLEKNINVFSNTRKKQEPAHKVFVSDDIALNTTNVINGIQLLAGIHNNVITAAFFDPQYRGIMDKMKYGNEGQRQKERAVG